MKTACRLFDDCIRITLELSEREPKARIVQRRSHVSCLEANSTQMSEWGLTGHVCTSTPPYQPPADIPTLLVSTHEIKHMLHMISDEVLSVLVR